MRGGTIHALQLYVICINYVVGLEVIVVVALYCGFVVSLIWRCILILKIEND